MAKNLVEDFMERFNTAKPGDQVEIFHVAQSMDPFCSLHGSVCVTKLNLNFEKVRDVDLFLLQLFRKLADHLIVKSWLKEEKNR